MLILPPTRNDINGVRRLGGSGSGSRGRNGGRAASSSNMATSVIATAASLLLLLGNARAFCPPTRTPATSRLLSPTSPHPKPSSQPRTAAVPSLILPTTTTLPSPFPSALSVATSGTPLSTTGGGAPPSPSSSTSPTSPPHTIQILMSDTGGGHRASANALRDALNTLHPHQFTVDIVDLYTDYGPFWPYNDYVRLYKIMAEYSWMWRAFYEFGCTPFGLWLNEFLLELFCFDSFTDCMGRSTPLLSSSEDEDKDKTSTSSSTTTTTTTTTERRADMVVSVHPLCQDVPLKVLTALDTNNKSRVKGRTTPFVTVVTDLGGAHPTWFNPGVDKCYVPSDALYNAARNRRVAPEQIVEYGLPIRSGFWSGPAAPAEDKAGAGTASSAPSTAGDEAENNKSGGWFGRTFFGGGGAGRGGDGSSTPSPVGSGVPPKSQSTLRTELGLTQSVPTVLIVGGGDGMGGIVEQARAVGRKLDADADANARGGEGEGSSSFQMVVVCGSNDSARRQLESDDGVTTGGVDVHVRGFVYNMDEYMRASDAIVTKAGPGTIAEASICGLPCMLSSFLPGQEEGNVPYVEENGFGTYSGDPQVIADKVSTWLETPELLAEMKARALEASRPRATLDIARDLAQIMFEHKGIK